MTDSKTDPAADGAHLDEPIDAEFQEAPSEPTRPARKRGPGWLSTLFLALLAAAGGGALGYGASELHPGLLRANVAPEPATAAPEAFTDLEAADTALETALDALETRLTRAESSLAARPTGPSEADLARLSGRLDAMENVAASDGEGVAPEQLQRALAAATARLDTLESSLDAPNPAIAALREDISSLSRRADTVTQRIDALEDTLETRIGDARSASAALADGALALSAMEAAARRGEGFATALSALQRLRPGDPRLGQLAPFAIDGAPTPGQLEDALSALRPALDAALSPPAPEGGAGGLAARLFGDAIEVRRDGDVAASGAVDDALAAMQRSDLGSAITALETLEGEAGEVIAPWLADARARRTLERTLDGLRLDLMAEDR